MGMVPIVIAKPLNLKLIHEDQLEVIKLKKPLPKKTPPAPNPSTGTGAESVPKEKEEKKKNEGKEYYEDPENIQKFKEYVDVIYGEKKVIPVKQTKRRFKPNGNAPRRNKDKESETDRLLKELLRES